MEWLTYTSWAIVESGGMVGPKHSPWWGLDGLHEEAQRQEMQRAEYRRRMRARKS